MSLVVLLRGVNVGGHRRIRPSELAVQLARFGVENVGAAGTFVVRRPGTRSGFRAELARRLPFETHVIICDGRELARLVAMNPLADEPSTANLVRFVSVLARQRRPSAPLPLRIPATGPWGVRITGQRGRFVFGVYRREMKAIAYLAQLDRIFGVPVTTRSWSTMESVARRLGAG